MLTHKTTTQPPTREEFLKLYKKGEKYEKKAQKYIMEVLGVDIITCQNSQNYKYIFYDFETSDGIKYEVKRDYKYKETKNIFIEFESFKKPSNIQISQADIYIIFLSKNKFIMIYTDELKKMIDELKPKKLYLNNGTGSGFIININDIKNSTYKYFLGDIRKTNINPYKINKIK